MKGLSQKIIYISLAAHFYHLLPAQVLVDDFEKGTADAWSVEQGIVEVRSPALTNSTFSARLYNDDAQSFVRHKTFTENWGIYEMQCMADGEVSDIQFIFQYVDSQNYYKVSCNPLETDNPSLMIWRIFEDEHFLLDSVDAIVNLNEWFTMKIERYCNGDIFISINDELQLSTNDRSIADVGGIAMAAWGSSSYFDDITFSASTGFVEEITKFICSGDYFEVDQKKYTEAGFYEDTLSSDLGCDSIVRLDLNIVPHYLVTEYDTICADSFYVFGSDTVNTNGRYNQMLLSEFGCDSLVELTLTVIGKDTIFQDTILCVGSTLQFNDETVVSDGIYLDTLFTAEGCSSIIKQNVVFAEPSIFLGEDFTACFSEGPEVMLEAKGYPTIQWSNGTSGESTLIRDPGVYWVDVFIGDCTASDTIEISESCAEDRGVYIPNVFTPNGDQINDSFLPVFMVTPENFSMRVFNRWGNLVYSSNDPSQGWTGDEFEGGTYAYDIWIDGEEHTGLVTILR